MNKKIVMILPDSAFFFTHRMALVQALLDHQYDITLVAPYAKRSHIDEIRAMGIAFYPVCAREKLNVINQIKFIGSIKSVIKAIDSDFILAFSVRAILITLVGYRLRYRIQTKFFGFVTGLGYLATSRQLSFKPIRLILKNLLKLALSHRCAHIVVQNKDDFLLFSKVISLKRLHLVRGSGVDTETFFPVPRIANQIVVTMVSRALKDKGLGEFIAAAKQLQSLRPGQIKMQFVGDVYAHNPSSFKREDLVRWSDEGLITWLGKRHDVNKIYQASDIAILPSYREGLPRSLLEAAACGLPIIATDVPGCREICIDGLNGVLVPVKNAQAIVEAIIQLADNQALRESMGAESRQLVEAHFSDSIINQQVVSLLT